MNEAAAQAGMSAAETPFPERFGVEIQGCLKWFYPPATEQEIEALRKQIDDYSFAYGRYVKGDMPTWQFRNIQASLKAAVRRLGRREEK